MIGAIANMAGQFLSTIISKTTKASIDSADAEHARKLETMKAQADATQDQHDAAAAMLADDPAAASGAGRAEGGDAPAETADAAAAEGGEQAPAQEGGEESVALDPEGASYTAWQGAMGLSFLSRGRGGPNP